MVTKVATIGEGYLTYEYITDAIYELESEGYNPDTIVLSWAGLASLDAQNEFTMFYIDGDSEVPHLVQLKNEIERNTVEVYGIELAFGGLPDGVFARVKDTNRHYANPHVDVQ